MIDHEAYRQMAYQRHGMGGLLDASTWRERKQIGEPLTEESFLASVQEAHGLSQRSEGPGSGQTDR